jgi:hypothetical protein
MSTATIRLATFPVASAAEPPGWLGESSQMQPRPAFAPAPADTAEPAPDPDSAEAPRAAESTWNSSLASASPNRSCR